MREGPAIAAPHSPIGGSREELSLVRAPDPPGAGSSDAPGVSHLEARWIGGRIAPGERPRAPASRAAGLGERISGAAPSARGGDPSDRVSTGSSVGYVAPIPERVE